MYLTLTKKRLLLAFFITVLTFFVLTQFFSVKANTIKLSTNAQRVGYIKSLGATLANDEFSQKDVVIPEEFGNVYNNYNVLQKQAGFDLNGYRGKEVSVYTYRLIDGKCVNLMIYKNKLIGGDIADVNVTGSMTSLKGK